ncbi:MAG: hypothetical protein CMD23_01955 [Flavobacteriales bacterium]|nr:hypothetical protein [Flavobacteriales bacterium]|tara:strand:- start:509 stop:3082 length:2574 start_codon:yes stop_codon:yes gene_type:complete
MNKNLGLLAYKYRFTILILLLLLGCSTQKDAALNRVYHQLNTKYNALFYAKEHLKTGVKKITELHTDNYKEILSINTYGSIKDAQNAQSSFDKAIEKSTIAIQQHSMDIDGKEKNKLIFQAYSIIGQAKFYKKEYLPAINTFNYIVRKSPDPEIQSEAALWSTRCQQQLNNQEAVYNNIQKLEDDYYLTKQQDAVLFEIKAERSIVESDFVSAEKYLLKAIKLSNIKSQKTRMYFVLGQIQLITDNYEKAINSFRQVVKKNPKYELVFNAKLNQTKAYSPSLNNFTTLKQDLNKMLRDKKNNEYQDQIYFALANMELKNNDTISAIKSLSLSARFSTVNLYQKIESHYALAELFWSKKDYINAYNHCDSAHQFAETNNENYHRIKKMLRNSKKVADLYTQIQHNDSIITLANLSEEERNQIIDQYIIDLQTKEEELKLNNDRGTANNAFNSYEYNKQTQNSMNITSSGGWYFYNPSAMSLGYSEFVSRWGNRKLEDNWRRKNKNQILTIEAEGADTLLRPPTEKEKYSRDYYLSQLPLKEEQQQLLLSKIETAYYDLAGVFSMELADYNQSIQLYNELITRFPSTDYRQLIYFNLHNIYNIKEDTTEANLYLHKIETEYPNSNYIEILKGNVPINVKLENDKKTYKKAHDLYVQFSEESCENLEKLLLKNQESLFVAEIELLNAFCQAEKNKKKQFIENLETIKTKHTDSGIINQIDTILLVLRGEDEYQLVESMYKKAFDSPHYFFLLINDIGVSLPETQLAISTFNEQNYKLDSLSTTNLLLNKDSQILRVGDFQNQIQAQTYYELIQENKTMEKVFKNQDIIPIVISEDNFAALLRERNINDYIEYFNKIYLLN